MRVLASMKHALPALLLYSSLGGVSMAEAARRKRQSMPSWKDIKEAAVETFFEEVMPTERLINELNDSAR